MHAAAADVKVNFGLQIVKYLELILFLISISSIVIFLSTFS